MPRQVSGVLLPVAWGMMARSRIHFIITDYFTRLMKKLLIIISISQLLLSGCSIHKLDVQQGNVITPEMLSKLHVGMSQERVRFLLGSPPMAAPFQSNRWDYTYTYREQDKQTETSHLILLFDESGLLTSVDQSNYTPPKERSSTIE